MRTAKAYNANSKLFCKLLILLTFFLEIFSFCCFSTLYDSSKDKTYVSEIKLFSIFNYFFVDKREQMIYNKVNLKKGKNTMTVNLLRIKAERVANGLTQEELAKKLGWARSQYAKRENGFVSFSADELMAVVKILGFSPSEIGIFFSQSVPDMEQE